MKNRIANKQENRVENKVAHIAQNLSNLKATQPIYIKASDTQTKDFTVGTSGRIEQFLVSADADIGSVIPAVLQGFRYRLYFSQDDSKETAQYKYPSGGNPAVPDANDFHIHWWWYNGGEVIQETSAYLWIVFVNETGSSQNVRLKFVFTSQAESVDILDV